MRRNRRRKLPAMYLSSRVIAPALWTRDSKIFENTLRMTAADFLREHVLSMTSADVLPKHVLNMTAADFLR